VHLQNGISAVVREPEHVCTNGKLQGGMVMYLEMQEEAAQVQGHVYNWGIPCMGSCCACATVTTLIMANTTKEKHLTAKRQKKAESRLSNTSSTTSENTKSYSGTSESIINPTAAANSLPKPHAKFHLIGPKTPEDDNDICITPLPVPIDKAEMRMVIDALLGM
jgi:hypothetical protein